MGGALTALLGAQMPGPYLAPTPGLGCSGHPVVQHVLQLPKSRQAAAKVDQAMGTVPQGSRGWKRGLLGRAWEGLGGGL